MINNIENLLSRLDGSGSDDEFDAIKELRKLLGNQLPSVLLKKYESAKKWQTRASCVYHSIRYARDTEDAVKLGIKALLDKSKIVRYRACMLLAWSLNEEALPVLKELVPTADEETSKDIRAAIDAIENKNSNYFVDRDHSGKATLKIH